MLEEPLNNPSACPNVDKSNRFGIKSSKMSFKNMIIFRHIIKCGSCPIAWSSKLQSEIALSTTEAECVSLSTSLRDLIPLQCICDELNAVEFIEKDAKISKTYSAACEDNRGALELAREPKFRPRTKHIATKHHHFRNAVAKGRIKILPIDAKIQQADIFTKPLPKPQFEKLRKLIQE